MKTSPLVASLCYGPFLRSYYKRYQAVIAYHYKACHPIGHCWDYYPGVLSAILHPDEYIDFSIRVKLIISLLKYLFIITKVNDSITDLCRRMMTSLHENTFRITVGYRWIPSQWANDEARCHWFETPWHALACYGIVNSWTPFTNMN